MHSPLDILEHKIYIVVSITYTIMRMKRKVWKNKSNGQKLLTIPKDSDIEDGDYVWIEKAD